MNYFEFNDGARAVPLPVQPKDLIEFTDETIEVATLNLEQLTPDQLAAYERAFR